MKKISLLVYHREKKSFLEDLQNLGILHIEIDEAQQDEQLETLTNRKSSFDRALNILEEFEVPDITPDNTDRELKLEDVVSCIFKAHDKIDKADQKISALEKERQQLAPWGTIDWETINKLREAGLHFRFFSLPKKELRSLNLEKVYDVVVNYAGDLAYLMVIDKGDPENLDVDPIKLPEKSQDEISAAIKKLETENESFRNSIIDLIHYKDDLKKDIADIDDKIFFRNAQNSYDPYGSETIHLVKGWIPLRQINDIKGFLDKKGTAYIIEDPGHDDDIPIILKNKKYSKLFETITKIFMLPNYREIDLTPVIAVFYPIFFAYCLGDSGYGLILVILFGIGYFKFLKSYKEVALLGMILGLFTMVIGILKSGTIFGIQILNARDIAFFDFFSRFVIVPDDTSFVFNSFNVALILGLTQIIVGVIASIVRAWIYESFEASLSSIGKLAIIIGSVTWFLGGAQEMELFQPYVTAASITVLAGIALVLLFNNIRLPILKRIGSGVLPLYFIFTGILGDTLSYIRLFALGISSGILGLVVNNIGHQIMESGGVMIVVAVIFLILGHGLNLAISGLGSFVHPLRLTFVEFYNNADFKGGGIEFRPFKKNITS